MNIRIRLSTFNRRKVIVGIVTAWGYILVASVIFLAGWLISGIVEFDRGFDRAALLCSQGQIERAKPLSIAGAGADVRRGQ